MGVNRIREVKYRVWDGIIMRYLIKTNYVTQTGFVDVGDDHETNVRTWWNDRTCGSSSF